jgi:putative membrane protein
MKLFDQAAKARIEAAIAELETRTAAEVVVAVVPHSGRPWLLRAVVAFGLALMAGVCFLEFGSYDPRWSPFVELAVAIVAFAGLGFRPLERLLVSPAVAKRDVEEEAFALFARHGVSRTRGRTGVLILLSELERRVVILGDQAIHERLGREGWQAHVERIVAAIKRGDAALGVVDVLRDLTQVLSEIAPVSGTNDDELSNRVIDES